MARTTLNMVFFLYLLTFGFPLDILWIGYPFPCSPFSCLYPLTMLYNSQVMKEQSELSQSKLHKDKSFTKPPTHKSPYKKDKDIIISPKKLPMRSKIRTSSGDLNLSNARKSTQGKEQSKAMELLHKKEKKEVPNNKDKRCIEPTEKIVDRINFNLQLLSNRIQELFGEEMEEDAFMLELAQSQTKQVSSSLLFKKNGSVLSLSKNSSKKRLEGRMTHDGHRSDRKYGQAMKGSKVSAEPGWK